MQPVEGLDVGRRLAADHPHAGLLGIGDATAMVAAKALPRRGDVAGHRDLVQDEGCVALDAVLLAERRPDLEPVEPRGPRDLGKGARELGAADAGERWAMIGERERDPPTATKRQAHVHDRQPGHERAAVAQRHGHRPVAVAVREELRPHRVVEDRRVGLCADEVGPARIVDGQDGHVAPPSLGRAAPILTGPVPRVLARRFHARYAVAGSSTSAGSGSSGARTANSMGPPSDER